MQNRVTIPGLAEAIVGERKRRLASFTPAPSIVAGVVLNPLTPATFAILEMIECPVTLGEEFPEPEDLAIFLWFNSTEFKADDESARRKFCKKLAGVEYYKALTEVQHWLRDQFEDCPRGAKNPEKYSPEFVSWVAAFVDVIAAEYGWSESEVLNIPFARLAQYLRAMRQRKDPKAVLFNPSDKVKGDWLRSINDTPEECEKN